MSDLLDALAYIHKKGIIHRDIKPHNIMIDKYDRTILADFGIARTLESTSFTKSGAILGTAYYLSPEQAKGLPIDHRVDIYSSGVTLYEMVTGELPFKGETTLMILYQHVNELPPLPSKMNPKISPEMEAVIMRALEKDPAKRFSCAEEMKEALNEILLEPKKVVEIKPEPLETIEIPEEVILKKAPLKKEEPLEFKKFKTVPAYSEPITQKKKMPLSILLPVVLFAVVLLSFIAIPSLRESFKGILSPKEKKVESFEIMTGGEIESKKTGTTSSRQTVKEPEKKAIEGIKKEEEKGEEIKPETVKPEEKKEIEPVTKEPEKREKPTEIKKEEQIQKIESKLPVEEKKEEIKIEPKPSEKLPVPPLTKEPEKREKPTEIKKEEQVQKIESKLPVEEKKEEIKIEPKPSEKLPVLPSTGGLVVSSSHPCIVVIDGKFKYELPPRRSIELSAGIHNVKFIIEGYESQSYDVEIAGGKVYTLHHRFTPYGKILINVIPWGNIKIDGKDFGPAPIETIISEGEHTVVVEREGYKTIKKVVRIFSGKSEILNLKLEKN